YVRIHWALRTRHFRRKRRFARCAPVLYRVNTEI
ncbi:hypothetical protein VTO73DRAFT_3593, partial [Trametes versicolor]